MSVVATETTDLLDAVAAAKILGVSRNHIYQLVQDGELAGERSEGTGRPLRFRPQDVELARRDRQRRNGKADSKRTSFKPLAVRLPSDSDPIDTARTLLENIPKLSAAERTAQLHHSVCDRKAALAASPGLTESQLRDFVLVRLLVDLHDGEFLTSKTPRFIWGEAS